MNPFDQPVTSLLIFGSQLLALSEDGGRLLIWDTNDGSEAIHVPVVHIYLTSFYVPAFQSSIQFEPGFTAISVLHPATYLNKVLVASSQGSMQLWNIRTQFVSSCVLKMLVFTVFQGLYPQVSHFESSERLCHLNK